MAAKYPVHISFHTTKFAEEQLRLISAQEGKDRSDLLRAALDEYVEGKLAAVPTRRTVTDGVKYRLDEMETHLTTRINQFERDLTIKLARVVEKLLADMGPMITDSTSATDQELSTLNNQLAYLIQMFTTPEGPRDGRQ